MKKRCKITHCRLRALACVVALLVVSASVQASLAVRKDSIHVWGEVQDFFTGDKLEKGIVTVYNEQDSIVLVDSVYGPRERFYGTWKYTQPAGYNFKLPKGGNYKIRFDIEGYVNEPQELKIPDRQYNRYTKEWMKNYKLRKKPKEHLLGEAVVKATRIKMVVKGDTVEYDADAFNLAEGSMLDKLLGEMPGMEIKENGEIYSNGKKVESLLVDGKDFFNGDPKMALDNLPAYTVKKVKVYRKDDDAAYLIKDSLKREEMKKLVVDVRLKKEYQKGWIVNGDVAYGTKDRFSSRVAAIYYTNVWKFLSYFNANNVNRGGGASDDGEFYDDNGTRGVTYTRAGGARARYDKDRSNVTVGVHGSHTTSFNNTATSSVTYLNSGDNYARSRTIARNSTSSIDWYDAVRIGKKNFWLGSTPLNGSHTRTRGVNSTNSVTFNGDPMDSYRLASLDSIFSPEGSDRLERMRLNAVLNATQSLTKATRLSSNSELWLKDPLFGNSIRVDYMLGYNDNQVENFQHYSLDNRQTNSLDIQNVYALTSSNSLEFNTTVAYSSDWKQKLSAGVSYQYSYKRNKNNPDRYRLDSLPGWDNFDAHPLGTLPSTSYLETKDRQNSYHRTITTLSHRPMLTGRLKLYKDWTVSIYLPLMIEQDMIEDTRSNGGRRKKAHLTSLNNTLSIYNFSHNENTGVVSNFSFAYYRSEALPSMGYLLDLIDDTNPLFISRGNANLQNSVNNGINMWYQYSNSKHMQNYGATASWNQTSNAVASTTTYDRSTGVTTYQPRNINGNWSLSSHVNLERTVDKKDRLTLKQHVGFNYNHNVDYITETLNQIATPLRSVVHNYTISEFLGCVYKYKKYNVSFDFGADWKMQNSDRQNFSRVNAVDLRYGVNSNGPLVWDFEYDTSFSLFSRRGYNESSMNDDHFVWNLNLSRSFLKNKALVLRLEAHDILGQLSNVYTVINAQGRTDTWYNSMPRYALLHVCYKFNSMAKKKADKE